LVQLTPEVIAVGLTCYVVLLFSLSVHEAAHAWAALRLGDDTALHEGRISLNPFVHIDPIGTVLMPLLSFLFTGTPLFGWAKPTPYNPGNFGRRTTLAQGHIIVAGAGPISNFLLALGFTGLFVVAYRAGLQTGPLFSILTAGIQINVILGLFNLVPLPPLDGSKFASWGLPRTLGDQYDRVMEPYGMWILLLLMGTGLLGMILGPIERLVLMFLSSLIR
jgi:Zn-dependent protease